MAADGWSECPSMSHLCPRCGEGEMQPKDDAWALCDRCGFTCCLDDLERASHRSQRAELNRQIHECLAEDRRRGSRNGGGDPGPKKEDKLGSRSLRQVTWTDEDIKVLGQSSLEPKGKIRTIKGLPEGTTGEKIRSAVMQKLITDGYLDA